MENGNKNEIEVLKSKAVAGETAAQVDLGRTLAAGAIPDLIESVRWFRAAAENGDPEAQYLLAVRYLNGQGVPQDNEEAVTWLKRSADHGHPGAQDSLGVRYATGQGVAQNDVEALSWFRRAAEQGHPVAQFNVGLAYAQGRGIPVDMVEAYAWFCLSAEQGDSVATGAVETVVESLSLDELRRARTLFHRLFAQLKRHPAGLSA